MLYTRLQVRYCALDRQAVQANMIDVEVVSAIHLRKAIISSFHQLLVMDTRSNIAQRGEFVSDTKHSPTCKYVAYAYLKLPLICVQKPTLVQIADKLSQANPNPWFTRMCLWTLVETYQICKRSLILSTN